MMYHSVCIGHPWGNDYGHLKVASCFIELKTIEKPLSGLCLWSLMGLKRV